MQSPAIPSKEVSATAGAADGKRSAAAAAAGVSKGPDGNHGDNLKPTRWPSIWRALDLVLFIGFALVVVMVDRLVFRLEDQTYRVIAEECVRLLK